MKWTFASHDDVPAGDDEQGDGFTLDDKRLTWLHGTLGLPKHARTAGWGLWLAIVETDALSIVASDSDNVLRIELMELALLGKVTARAGQLWIKNEHGVWIIPLAELEAIYEHPKATVSIDVETTYPHRAPNARVLGKVAWLNVDDALVNVGRAQLRLDHRQYGLEKGMEVAFVDALGPNRFVAIDVPGRPRQILHEPLEPYTIIATVTPRRPHRPDKPVAKHVAMHADVEQLLREIADHPEDDHSRAVLIDLLADRGESCAVAFAQLRAGEKPTPNRIKTAVGPLAKFFKPIAFDRGLPSAATLVKKPEEDPAEMLADMRLDMLREIRIGDGSAELYAEVMATRRLISLRVVDVGSFDIMRILKEAEYNQLERVCNVPWASDHVIWILAGKMFSSVKRLEVVVYLENAAYFINWLTTDRHGLLTPSRELVIREAAGREPSLARELFGHLDAIHASFTIGDVTLKRFGDQWRATVGEKSHHGVRGSLRDILPHLL